MSEARDPRTEPKIGDSACGSRDSTAKRWTIDRIERQRGGVVYLGCHNEAGVRRTFSLYSWVTLMREHRRAA